MVTALMIKPGQQPEITQLCDDRAFLDLAVSRDTGLTCTAVAMPLEKDIAVINPEEGVSLCLPGNRRVNDRIIAGTFYIAEVKGGELRSLTDAEITKYASMFWEIEVFDDDEVFDSWFCDVFEPL